jgi:NADPH2:quinone reductase
MKAIRIYEHGGPEVLRFEEMPRPIPRATEVLVRNEAIGVNFVDTQHRAGLNYPVTLPLIPGIESIGEVARAHRLLESREVVGKLVLLP